MFLSEGDRVGLIGPNGSGKTTLLQILAGTVPPDEGAVTLRRLARLGYVPQNVAFPAGLTVRQVIEEALAESEHIEDAEKSARVATAMGQAGFTDGAAAADSLSGGWRKRLAVARELVRDPDLLLLDEPTNHLDLEGILWLEKLLENSRFACVVVSHDRYFLENVATQMAELNRVYPEGIFRAPGSYSDFLIKKEEFLTAQNRQQEALENRVRREIEWLRRGPKARTGKSRARIDSAGRLIEELADINARSRTATAQIDFTASDRRTKKLIEARGIGKSLGGRNLFRGLNLKLSPGMRLGLAGANGTGKTTLLRILNAGLEADEGTVERADALQVVYFDQYRAPLDPELSLRRSLAPHGDSVIYRGRPTHVAGWARRFLFRAEQLDQPVGRLSGGEQARVMIARLMLESADVLLLDEPTNDLDIPTLEVLEDSLMEFPGALVLVTHDRYMMDRVSTAVLGLDGEGGAGMFADYSQWEQAQAERKQSRVAAREAAAERPQTASGPGKKRLSYIESREWEAMEGRIFEAEAALDERKAALEKASASGDARQAKQAYEELTAAHAEVDRLYARWAELEAKLT